MTKSFRAMTFAAALAAVPVVSLLAATDRTVYVTVTDNKGAPVPDLAAADLVVKEGGKVLLLPVEQVDWVEADDYYVQVHAGGKSHLLRQTLREVEAQLDPRRFLRIHRSTLVNVARVKSLEPLFHGEYLVVLQDGRKLKLSRSYRDRLDALLAGR